MPKRDLTLADKIALLEQIKNQPPNTSHYQLVEITGVPKCTTAHVIQCLHATSHSWGSHLFVTKYSSPRVPINWNPLYLHFTESAIASSCALLNVFLMEKFLK
jgi:hypothetical protein